MSTFTLRDAGRGLLIQWQVVHALVLRETRTRFGQHKLGYLWALVEPISTIGVLGGMMVLIGRPDPLGDNVITFLATGFMPFLLFRSVASSGATAVRANKALLYYPQVQPLDLILARTSLEFATLGFVFVLLFGGMAVWERSLVIDSALNVLLGLTVAGMLGSSLGLILCAASILSSVVDQIVAIILRPLFWLSAIFYTVNDLPPIARTFILYNPIVHCTETLRDGWYANYTTRYADLTYALGWALGMVFVGLMLERVARRKVADP